ncbi:AAA family ATPase [Spectribacter hydrogenooxidans]|uniref:AAA family ATPase n=1 Tax=Spectribacter hydrogenoxidans TaxID=3075608 RepID=A0ABU3BZY2_9GAMM|nr:AAA family ATPase [Salinisphaera sp. W335]MDT0634876.1 AAA family ATPase [Salinisphaera sp. W335]
MLDQYERAVLMGYCHRMTHAPLHDANDMSLMSFLEWAGHTGELHGLEEDVDDYDGTPRQLKALLKQIRTQTSDAPPACKPSALQRRIEELSRQLGLDALEQAFIGAMARYSLYPPAVHMFDGFNCDLTGLEQPRIRRTFAHALGYSDHDLRQAMAPASRLSRYGLVEIRGCSELPGFIKSYLDRASEPETLAEHVLGDPLPATLAWEDFAHLGDTRDRLLRVLDGAMALRHHGVNVLLYGVPGVGKTEFCKTIAAKLGISLFALGESDDEAHEPSRRERIGAVNIARRLLGERSDALLLVDEADDIIAGGDSLGLFGGRSRKHSRVYLHRLLEQTTCPTFWVVNDLDGIEPSVMRRMSYAIDVRTPGSRVREQMWQQLLEREDIDCEPVDARRLSQEFRSAPAIADTAVTSARLAGGSLEDVREITTGLVCAMNQGRAPTPVDSSQLSFDPALINPSVDLAPLEARLSADPNRPVSLCISGPSGTGKSAYLRHLAHLIDMDVVHLRGSDLLSKWVGETEQKIAEAFQQAAAERAFLIIDEVEAMLSQRDAARHTWENSRVNELLTWVEVHPVPFGVTTNHADQLDRASLRRFTFQIRFDYLDQDALAYGFRTILGLSTPPATGAMARVTTADLVLARRQAEILDLLDDREAVIRRLTDLVEQREGRTTSIGFIG